MKQLLFIFLFLYSIFVFSKALPVDYHITSSKEDKQLSKMKSKFIFTFKSHELPAETQVRFSYNGIENKLNTNSKGQIVLDVKPGKYVFMFYIYGHFEVITDSVEIKPSYITEMEINFRSSEHPTPMKKPVIYVYPAKKENVCIELKLKGNFSFTYPEYKNGWNFTVDPTGNIEINGKKYAYLFWDGNIMIDKSKLNLNEGFIVDKINLVSFFEEKLTKMGLNSREIQDYITYWCPLMNTNESNYVYFMFNDECDDYAKMQITPKPDNIFRVYMLWSDAKDRVTVSEQKIQTLNRSGFTVVEWGGGEMNDKKNL